MFVRFTYRQSGQHQHGKLAGSNSAARSIMLALMAANTRTSR
uniref:Uncharacterized protein n=1 Tax=Klebsiella pneumoniae TaxID=573 RepID=A0A2R4NDY7_KLEPN|nr:hypothetical protein [Klebsiella pneumoniae]